MVSFIAPRHSHSYRRATKAGQSTLEQANTVLSMSWTLSQAKVKPGNSGHVGPREQTVFR